MDLALQTDGSNTPVYGAAAITPTRQRKTAQHFRGNYGLSPLRNKEQKLFSICKFEKGMAKR